MKLNSFLIRICCGESREDWFIFCLSVEIFVLRLVFILSILSEIDKVIGLYRNVSRVLCCILYLNRKIKVE